MDPIFRMLRYSENFQKNTAYNHAIMTLCQHLDDVAKLPIDQMADLCMTNAMTLSRIARKLGYDNYVEFRKAAAETTTEYYYLNRSIPLSRMQEGQPAESFLDYMEELVAKLRTPKILGQIKPACRIMHEARTIHYYGSQAHNLAVTMLLHDLIVDGKEVHPYYSESSVMADLDTIQKGDLVLYSTVDMDNKMDVIGRILRQVEKMQAKVMLLCGEGDPLLDFVPGPNLCYPVDHTSANVLSNQFLMNMVTMTYRELYVDKMTVGMEEIDK